MRATQKAKDEVAGVLELGDVCVDATLGNGYDALFLAELVGEEGKVYGFDVQGEAIESSRVRLENAGVVERVVFHHRSHAEMGEVIEGEIKVVMFNLGYLPGGDHGVITRVDSTLAALAAGLALLEKEGLLSVVCYPGHAGGEVEAEKVVEWAERLDDGFRVDFYGHEKKDGQQGGRPFWVGVWKA